TAAVPLLRRGAATGTPSVAGNWTGRAVGKRFDLGPGGASSVGNCPFDLTVTQTGATVGLALTLNCPGQSAQLTNLTGEIGNGHRGCRGGGGGECRGGGGPTPACPGGGRGRGGRGGGGGPPSTPPGATRGSPRSSSARSSSRPPRSSGRAGGSPRRSDRRAAG